MQTLVERYLNFAVAIFLGIAVSCSSSENAPTGGSTGMGTSTTASTTAFDGSTTAPPKSDLGFTPPAACDPYCATRSDCLGQQLEDCLMACTTDYDSNTATSSACGTAFEEQLACAAALSCEEFTAWTGHMGEYPCKSADDELTTACTGTVPEACTSSCEVVAMCTQGSQPQCEAACTQGLEMFEAIGPQCVTDQTSLLECVAGLDCAQYELYDAGAGEYPCKSEADAAQLSCME